MKLIYLTIRYLIILDYYFERFLTKYLFKTRYKRVGHCKQCGQCCEVIGVKVNNYVVSHSFFAKLIIVFYEKVNNFSFEEYNREENYLLFSCNNFNKEQRKCNIYSQRPGLCRNYPYVRYFDKPTFMDGCNFSAELRD